MTSIAEETGAAQATATGKEPKATKKARVGQKRAHVAPKKGKPAPKAKAPKKAPKAAQKADGARDGSKAAKILDLLKRPDGVTLKELIRATDWQPHSIRGFLSGPIVKKMGLAVAPTKGADGERTSSITTS